MDLLMLGPLRCTSMFWQHAAGSWTLTIVCKATYRLAPDMSPLHQEQERPNEEDRHWDDDPNRSLSAPSDLVPFKARADVLLVGSAFAPDRRPVQSLVARLCVGTVDKSIEVFGKRALTPGGAVQEGPGFTSMPLAYERAAGGPDTCNPVGMRLEGLDAYGNTTLPNLQPMGMALNQRGDLASLVGFGPIAPAWRIRAERLGRHRGSFFATAWRNTPVPEDLDPAYFNAAPGDQQVEAIRADERIEMENLHPKHARLVTHLPGLRPRVFAEKAGEAPQEVVMRSDTLWIDTGRGICTLVWRGHVPVEGRAPRGRVLVAMEERGQRVGWAEVARMASGRPESSGGDDNEATKPPNLDARGRAVMPFLAARENEAPAASERIAPPTTMSPWAASAPRAPGLSVGQIAAFSPNVPPPGEVLPVEAAAKAKALPAAREGSREVLELLWYDPAALPRLRRHLAWKKIIAELKPRPSDDDFDGGLPAEQMKAAKDKRDVFGVLARGEVQDLEGIRRAMEMAILDDGSFVPPYVLTAGVLEFQLDETEALKATLVAVAPFVPLDQKLKETVDYVNEVMKTPGIERGGAVVDSLRARVKATFEQGSRGVPAGSLDAQVERMLVEGRCYRKQVMMGGKRLHAKFAPAGASEETMLAYLDESVAPQLPMLCRFEARVIVEARTPVAPEKEVTIVLKALATVRRIGVAKAPS